MSDQEKMNEVIEWLSHPNELGKAPSKIEFVKEFTDPEGFECQIYKFKKGLLSPWLLAINSESGVFSEQEKYDEAHDVEMAQKLLDYLKEYWKNMARKEEERKERAEKAETSVAFILKKEAVFDPDQFLDIYEREWGERLNSADGSEDEEKKEGVDARIFENAEGLKLVLGYMDFKIPDEEAELNAAYNYLWKEAVETAASHKAHEVVSIMSDGDLRDKAMFYAKACIALCMMDNNIGVYSNGIVYNPEMFTKMKQLVADDELPIPLLVWVGLGREENGISAWTNGMKNFGFEELEVINSSLEMSELQGTMYGIIDYCVNNGISFHDGEKVKLAVGLEVAVEKSAGFNVDEEGETLKLTING